MNFTDLGLIAPILRALKEKNYSQPTEIQHKAIPLVLDRKDVLGCAQTGTGKTAAFSIPMIQLIHRIEGKNKRPTLRGLILSPTRELAIQIDEQIRAYSKHTIVKHTVIYGGVKQGKQVDKLRRGVHILVATPGRLLDLIGQGLLDISTVKMFVLDEADRMLDMGFIHDINKVIKMLPKKRQSLFFSATMPDSIVKLSQKILRDPVEVAAARVSSAADTVQQLIYYTNRATKKNLLLHVLKDPAMDQVLLFSRTKHGADRIARDLKKKNIIAQAIHGDKSQNHRQKVLQQFKKGKIRVLVATDIAARGIDVQQLQYVINYDLPNVPEDYVHRIGRTGRAGESGVAISFCEPEENVFAKDIEQLIKKKITVIQDHPFPQTDRPMTNAEKKEWRREKEKRKQEYFAKRNNKKRRKQTVRK